MKDIIMRALKTFWQAGLAYILVEAEVLAASGFTIQQFLTALAIGFVGAGASAVYNGLKNAVVSNSKDNQ